MKIVFDTNIILDAMLERVHFREAQSLVMSAATGEIEGVVTGNSVTDIYYLSRKAIGDAGARKLVYDVLTVFCIAPVDGEACAMALNTPMRDYEDALLAVCAAREGADYIATNDRDFLTADSPVPVQSPSDLLTLLREE